MQRIVVAAEEPWLHDAALGVRRERAHGDVSLELVRRSRRPVMVIAPPSGDQ